MQRFNRYLAANVLGATLAVLAVLVGLDALSSVIDEVDDLLNDLEEIQRKAKLLSSQNGNQ